MDRLGAVLLRLSVLCQPGEVQQKVWPARAGERLIMPLPESKFIRRPQLDLVLKHLESRPRDRLLVLLAASLGLRVTEVVHMQVEDFRDVGRGWVWVRSAKKRAKDGKRPLERLPITQDVAREVRKYTQDLDYRRGWLFEGRDDGHVGERQAFHVFSEACKACGLGHKSFHALRHYRGFTVQEARGDPTITKIMLRHKDLRSTQVYTQRTPDEEQALAKEIGW
jgi:integrase